jgi:hypothetical protein
MFVEFPHKHLSIMSVRFAKNRKVKVYSKVGSFQREEVWWSARDYRSFRGQCAATVGVMESGEDIQHSQTHCFRGLERFPQEKNRERRKKIRGAILLVLSEQECLKHQGVQDQFKIAQKYEDFCARCRLEGHLRGLYDEESQLWQILEDRRRDKQQQPAPKQTITTTGKRNLCIDEKKTKLEKIGRRMAHRFPFD